MTIVIFISIDDHEVYNLRLVMNEIFGEENFFANVVWRRTVSRAVSGRGIAVAHDHILCYGKSVHSVINKVGIGDTSGYKNPDDYERGVYKLQKLERTLEGARPTMTFPIMTPLGEITRTWSVSPDKYRALSEDNRIAFSKSGTPYYKQFLSEFEGVLPDTWWDKEGGNNQDGSRDFKELFGQDELFSFPKPVKLLKVMLQIATVGSPDEIVMDFFSGGGTTAQAVLERNEEDDGNQKFILVQLPESTNSKELPTIASIARERVRRVLAKLEASAPAKSEPRNHSSISRGFKAFRLAASNFKIWDDQAEAADQDALTRQLDLFADNLMPDATPENILFEILLKAGYDLNAPREEITVVGQPVQSIADGSLLICLERSLSREVVDGLIARAPRSVICLDEAFHGDDALLTNTLLQMQDAGIVFQTI